MSATDRPIAQAPDITAFMEAYLEASGYNEQSGVKNVRQYGGGVNLRQELKSPKYKGILKRLEKAGLDLDKNYGTTTEELRALKERVAYVKKYASREITGVSNRVENDEKRDRSIQNLVDDIGTYGESDFELVPEKMAGLSGVGTLERFKAIRKAQQAGQDVSKWTGKDWEKALKLKKDTLTSKDVAALQAQTAGEEFETFSTIEDTARMQLQAQKDSVKNFQAAQARVNAPGYAQTAVDQAFAPQQTELDQFYLPQGQGTTISEAGRLVGEQEAAMGRTGNDRTAVELARQQSMARERLSSQKSAARGQIQSQIDMNNPFAALQAGQQSGQLGMGNLDYQRQQLLAPYAAVYPMMSQAYRDQLLPFQMQQQVQQGPGAIDYGIGIGGVLAQTAGAIYGG